VPLLAEMVREKSKQAWISALEAAGVPCGPINNLDEVFDDPQVKARGICVDLPHPATGHVKLTASPMKLAVTPPQYETAPPLLGQHTDEVLGELLGYRPDQIASLRDKGIL